MEINKHDMTRMAATHRQTNIAPTPLPVKWSNSHSHLQ